MPNENIKMYGRFDIKHYRNGIMIDRRKIDNLITTAGLAEVAKLLLTDTASDDFDYIAVGTGSTAANVADTTLDTELAADGLSRAAGSGTTAAGVSTLTKTFSVTGTQAVVESGVLNQGAGGDLLCRQVFSALNVVNGDTLAITWNVTFS